MADFISGADLVARGAEGTGAATVLNNQPTIQNLARLGGRMDNLYKTQEMLKMKLAAAKQEKAKEPKQPNLNPLATGGVIGDYLGTLGNQYMQSIAAIKGAKYNQKVSTNDIAGANQEAADVASALATLNPVVQNTDRVVKNWFTQNESFYKPTTQTALKIQSEFPGIDPDKLNALPTIEEKEKYIMGNYNQFLQSDPQRVIRSATLGDPATYNYNGTFQVIDKNLVDRNIDIQNANGTARATKASELFKQDPSKKYVELDYPKAIAAIQNVPQANEQMEYLAAKAVKDSPVLTTEAFRTLPEDQKKKKIEDIAYKAKQDYAADVFRTGLTYDQKADFETTRARAESEYGGRLSAENEPEIAQGPQRFNRKTELLHYDPAKKAGVKEPADITVVASGETFVMKKPVVMDANQVFLPMGRFNAEDKASLNAREYKNADGTIGNMYVGDKSFTLNNAKRVTGMPVFVMAVNDSKDQNIVYQPGDWVPEHMMTAKKIRDGKEIPWLEKGNYIEVDGYVGSPEVSVVKGTDLSGNPIYEKAATTQNFYPDRNSSDLVINAIRNGMKNAPKNIFEKTAQEKARKKK